MNMNTGYTNTDDTNTVHTNTDTNTVDTNTVDTNTATNSALGGLGQQQPLAITHFPCPAI